MMLHSLGVISFLGAVSGRQDPALGRLGFRAERLLFPWLQALHREWDAGWAPALDALCSLMTGCLAPALCSWQGPCDLGWPMTWGSGQAGSPWPWEQRS